MDLSRINPVELKLYQAGEEAAIRVITADPGSFSAGDYVEFYGEKRETKYSDTNVYWLVNTAGAGLRMEENSTQLGTGTPLFSFLATQHEETNNLYWGEQPGDNEQERWLWQVFFWGGTSESLAFNLTNLDSENPENPARIEIVLWGFLDMEPHPNHHVYLYLNDNFLAETTWDGRSSKTLSVDFPQSYLIEGENTLTISPLLDTGCLYDLILVDWFDIYYWKKFVAEENECRFTNSGADSSIQISGFSQPEIKLYDVSNAASPVYRGAPSLVEAAGGTYAFNFAADFSRGAALTEDKIKSPEAIEKNEPSSLQVIFQQADYLIITPGDFYDEILPLAELRASQGLSVKVVKLKDIYDEFNFGIDSPYAIKNFLSFTYQYWLKPAPTYVLLVGDATYDYKYYWGRGTKNVLPTYLLLTPYLGETASDNWFVCLDPPQSVDGQAQDDFLPDMFLGRFPVKSAEEVTQAVNKIFGYEAAAFGGWEKKVILVSDNEELMFEETNDLIQSILPAEYQAIKIYLSRYETPAACQADIIKYFTEGSLMLNYIGHGSSDIWASEYIFQSCDLESINNPQKYPFVITMNCLNGWFIYPFADCLAEAMFLPAEKGAIACWSPTGMGVPHGHRLLEQGLFQAIFQDYQHYLGAATTQAKIRLFAEAGDIHEDLIQTYCLFGDPALELPISPAPLEEIDTIVITAPKDEESPQISTKSNRGDKTKSNRGDRQEKETLLSKDEEEETASKKIIGRHIQSVKDKAKEIIESRTDRFESHGVVRKSTHWKRKAETSGRGALSSVVVGAKKQVEDRRKDTIGVEVSIEEFLSGYDYREVLLKGEEIFSSARAGMRRLLTPPDNSEVLKKEPKAALISRFKKIKEKYTKIMEERKGGISAAEVMRQIIGQDIPDSRFLKRLENQKGTLASRIRKIIQGLINRLNIIRGWFLFPAS